MRAWSLGFDFTKSHAEDFTNKDLAATQESLHTTQNSLSDCFNEVAVVRSDLERTAADRIKVSAEVGWLPRRRAQGAHRGSNKKKDVMVFLMDSECS